MSTDTVAKKRRRSATAADAELTLTLDRYVPGVLIWLTNKLSADASRDYRKRFDIGITDWRVLAYLGVHGIGLATDIVKLIGLDKAAVSRSIGALKTRGLLHTEKAKGRAIHLRITTQGRAEYQKVLARALQRERALMTGFTEQEGSLLLDYLHRMLGNLERINAADDGQAGTAGQDAAETRASASARKAPGGRPVRTEKNRLK